MKIRVATNMSEEQRRQMQQMMEKMEQLPEQQRKQMEKMVGNPMEMMKQMMSGEPIAIEVQSVQVNTNIPDGIF